MRVWLAESSTPSATCCAPEVRAALLEVVQPLRQLAETAVQLVGPIQQGQRTSGKLGCARPQLGSTVQKLAHGIIQSRDAVGQAVEAVEVKDLIPLPQRLGGGSTGQQDLRCCQLFYIGLHGQAVL